MKFLWAIVITAPMAMISGCYEGTQFVQMPSYVSAGMGVNNATVALTPTPTEAPDDPPPVPENRTTIQMITQQIINNAPDQFLEVKVAYEGLSGNPADFPFDQLNFDIASTTASEIHALDYTVTVSNSLQYTGTIDPVWGADLFGNTGSNYFHFATDQLLDIPAGVTWFTFRVDLSYTINHPYGATGTPPPSEQIQVYVRFGEDSMLASAPVTFINQ